MCKRKITQIVRSSPPVVNAAEDMSSMLSISCRKYSGNLLSTTPVSSGDGGDDGHVTGGSSSTVVGRNDVRGPLSPSDVVKFGGGDEGDDFTVPPEWTVVLAAPSTKVVVFAIVVGDTQTSGVLETV